MVQTVQVGNEVHEFPDEATPEMIAKAVGVNLPSTQQSMESEQPEQPMSLVDHVKNLGAGVLSGGVNMLRSLPDLRKYDPLLTEQSSRALYGMGINEPRPIDKFDPYKFVGVEEKPYTTGPGLEQLVGELLTPMPVAAKAAEPLLSFFRKINPKNLIKKLQASHDAKMALNSNLFNEVRSGAIQRGISQIPISGSELDKAAIHLPKTARSKNLIDAAKTGDYEALHELQSDLFKKGSKWASNGNKADENAAEELFEVRDYINKSIQDHFRNLGHDDLADKLNQARSGWRNLKETYYSHNPIKRVIDPNLKSVPEDPIKFLSKDNVPMRNLLKEHPEIERDVALYLFRQQLKDNPVLRKALEGTKFGAKWLGAGVLGGAGLEGTRRFINRELD